tara:strand:+ start:312 stop:1007 length:696 start_codon:yes stop_codon:yes gene_type:complete
MSFGAIAVGTIGGIVSMVNAGKNRELAEDQLKEARLQRQEQQARLDRQKAEYKSMQFKNPFTNMENVFEDLTVNQQQAQFEAQQGAQQRANIMQSLKGAAGASGIAGLAQALANQGQLQTQRISASIGQQESRNQMAAAKGASAIQIAERQGDQFIQQAEMDRQATLLGMQMGVTTGANLGFQQAQANQMNAMIQQQQSMMDFIGGLAEPVGDAFGNISLPERKKKQKGKS